MQTKKTFIVQILKRGIIMAVILLSLISILLVTFYFWGSAKTIPSNQLSEIVRFSTNQPLIPPEQKVFTLMTFNIGYLSGIYNNRPVKTTKSLFENNLNSFTRLVDQIQPDFIQFQEIDFASHRSYFIDQFRETAEKTRYGFGARAINWDKRYVPFPFGFPSVHFGKILSGQAVLSRNPILYAERIVLEKPKSNTFIYNAFYLDRLAQVVKIKLNNHILVIINVHLEAFHTQTREKQAHSVLDIFHKYKNEFPVILCGDFNTVPPNAPSKKNFTDEPETDFSSDRTLDILLNDISLEAAELSILTFPSDKPTRKLDYIFFNKDKIHPIEITAPKITCSDHYPLVFKFSFKDEKKTEKDS